MLTLVPKDSVKNSDHFDVSCVLIACMVLEIINQMSKNQKSSLIVWNTVPWSYFFLGCILDTSHQYYLPKNKKLVGMLFRKFCCHIDSLSLLKLYLSTVRPHLEYASSVWDPYLKQNIEAIEQVQKFALKVCQKDWHSDYVTLLNITNVPPLAARRKALKLCQLFSILQGHSEFPDLPTSKRVSRYLNCIRSTNSATLT